MCLKERKTTATTRGGPCGQVAQFQPRLAGPAPANSSTSLCLRWSHTRTGVVVVAPHAAPRFAMQSWPRITRADHLFSPPRPTDFCIQTSKLVFWTSPSFARVWSDIDHFAVAVNCRTSLCNLCFDSALLPFPPTVRHALFDRWQLHHTIACHDASYFPPFPPALPGARVQAGGCFSLLYFYYIPLHCSGRPLSRVIKRGFALHFRGFSATQLLLRSFSVRSAPKTVERSEYFGHLFGQSNVWFDAHVHLGEADDQLALSPLVRSLANKSIVDKLPPKLL